MQTPGLPVSRPCVAAMNAAACSCRVRMSSIERRPQRFDDVEILLARDAEDAVDALILERRDQQI